MVEPEERAPEVLSPTTIGLAVAIHVVCFLAFWVFAKVHFKEPELVIPIDFTVIPVENLDGNEEEPPPLEKPVPQPPPPKPVVKPPEPKPEPKVEEKLEAVEQVKETKKPEKPKIKEPVKPKEPEKPKDPQKTKEQLLQERLKRMQDSAKDTKLPVVKPTKPQTNGRTEKSNLTTEQVREALMKGARVGRQESIPQGDMQLGLSLVRMAINDSWSRLQPEIGQDGYVDLAINFDGGGRITNCRLLKSSGDTRSDNAAIQAVRAVGVVRGLPAAFIDKFRGEALEIHYKVVAK